MSAPTIFKNAAETIAEKTKPVVKEIKGQIDPTGGIKESMAQMFGLPLPDETMQQIQEQDAAVSGMQIAEKQKELATIAGKKNPSEQITPLEADRIKRDTGLTHEEAQARRDSTLFHDAQKIGQTEENTKQRQEQQRRQEEEEERLQKEKTEQERLAQPITMPGTKGAPPVSGPVANRQSTGETLRKRDT